MARISKSSSNQIVQSIPEPEPTFGKVSNTFVFNPNKNTTPVNVDSIEGMTKATDKKVKGEFANIEAPGYSATVNAKLYKGMDYFYKVFQDGEKCTIPLSVARFINERCHTTSHRHTLDDKGEQSKTPIQRARYKFIIESMAA